MRCIDLTLPISKSAPGVEVEEWLHEDGARRISRRTVRMPGDSRRQAAVNWARWRLGTRRIRPADLPDGVFLSNEFYRMSVHQGTHVDAPYHYGPQCLGKPAPKIADLPLERFIGPGVVLDVTGCDSVGADEIEKAIATSGQILKEGTIALLRSDADLRFGTPAYYREFPGITPDGIDALVERGVRVIGTDGWGFDRPVPQMVSDFYRSHDRSVLWPAHFHGRNQEYLQIEGLANLRDLPATPFTFIAFPLALRDAGGSWCRAVGIPDDQDETISSQTGLAP